MKAKIDEATGSSDDALRFLARWKTDLERETNQEIVLITYYPVQTSGG